MPSHISVSLTPLLQRLNYLLYVKVTGREVKVAWVVGIIDDTVDEARSLERIVRDFDVPQLTEAAKVILFPSLSIFGAYIAAERQLDALFVDISLSGESFKDVRDGIDLVQSYIPRSSHTQVIFMTGFDQFYTRVYEARHVSFVRKPFNTVDVNLALSQALEASRARTDAPLAICCNHAVVLIRPSEVSFIESDRRCAFIHEGARVHRVYRKLSDLLDELPAQFVRCHQSFLINLDFVEKLGTDSLLLSTGDTVPVSRRCRTQVRDALFERIGSAF